MSVQPAARSRFGWKNLLILAIFFILSQRACSPPSFGTNSDETIPLVTIDSFYNDVRSLIDIPIIIEGEVVSSFYLAPLGGFFFVRSLESDKTMICLLKELPPKERSVIWIRGVIKPVLVKGERNLTYIKYKSSQPLNTFVHQ